MKTLHRANAARTFRSILRSVSQPLRVAALAVTTLLVCGGAQAQGAFISEIRAFAFGYCPKGWTSADGSLRSIQTNTPMFALVGTTYGGNGQNNFGLPDLRGRTPLGSGTDSQNRSYSSGQVGGQEAVILSTAQMPEHVHTQIATTAAATHATPTTNALLAQTQNAGLYVDSAAQDTTLATAAVGNNVPVPTRDPYLAITWCVATQGFYPPSP